MTETWKDIDGYNGLYQVSNLGKVLSLPKGDGNGFRLRELKQEKMIRSATTYRRVALSKDGKVKRFSVHRLVAQAFVSNPDNKPQVNHLDSNGSNNKASNLEWCTQSENMIHSVKHGNTTSEIQRAKRAKVKNIFKGGNTSPAMGLETDIYKDFKKYKMKKIDIAKKYNLSIDTIYNAIKRQITKED